MPRLSSALRAVVLCFAITLAGWSAGQAAEDEPTLVFAAASLKEALDGAVEDYWAQTGHGVEVSYAASSALAKQIEQGAPAGLFLSADVEWMEYLAQRELIEAGSRTILLGNELVLIAPASYRGSLEIAPGFDLARSLADGRLAIGATASVPVGKYAMAALKSLGVWDSVSEKLAETENTRAALALVSRGEAPFGIVYATDAKADPGVRVVGTFPADSHPPILYPVALTADADRESREFLNYLTSEKARGAFERAGFRFAAAGS